MRIHKSESVNQYGQGDSTVCVTRAAWRRENGVTKKNATLFIGAAYGEVSRKFAAGIIRQYRRTDTGIRNLENRGTK
jgi:hypothetical protein